MFKTAGPPNSMLIGVNLAALDAAFSVPMFVDRGFGGMEAVPPGRERCLIRTRSPNFGLDRGKSASPSDDLAARQTGEAV